MARPYRITGLLPFSLCVGCGKVYMVVRKNKIFALCLKANVLESLVYLQNSLCNEDSL